MSNMKEITTSKGVFLFVEVPNDACDFKLDASWELAGKFKFFGYKNLRPVIKINPITVIILSTTKDINDEQAKIVVEKHVNMGYRNYNLTGEDLIKIWTTNWNKNTAKESLQSLLEANGLDESKNYLILQKVSQ